MSNLITTSDYLNAISLIDPKYLVKMLDKYNKIGLRDLTHEQVETYYNELVEELKGGKHLF